MTSVLVIDDHPIVLQGCRRMLEDAGITSVGTVTVPDEIDQIVTALHHHAYTANLPEAR